MKRSLFVLAVGIGLGCAAMAQHHKDGESVRLITVHNMQEKIDGKEAKASVVEVTINPGESGLPHRHPGPGLVYVLEGQYELGIDDKPTQVFKAGETFYEPTGC